MPPSIFIGSLAMAAACPPPPPPPPSDGFGGGGPGGGGWKGPPGGGHKGEGLHWSKKQQYRHKKKYSDLMNQFDIKVHLKNFCGLTNFVFLNWPLTCLW